ncbi:MAG: UDP-glucose 4-epimerase GalE [Propionicimonas sp.]
MTGGSGYIASHTAVQLIAAGHEPVLLDNLSNSKTTVIDRIEQITGVRPECILGDVRDESLLSELLSAKPTDAVIHFAGLKSVGESAAKPLEYYDNNVNGSIVLARAMRRTGVRNLVFSSSATVYGDPEVVPITEGAPTSPANPYGRSKLMVEEILGDLVRAEPDWSVTLLRYFNPIGAHPSGLIGEDPHGIPNNLTPYITQVAVGRLERLNVFGGDYPTMDGTGVRDYIHVLDLADGHIAALQHGQAHPGLHVYNLGTGTGSSVLDVLRAFERAAGRTIPYQVVARRPGDIPACWADPARAVTELGWRAIRSLDDMAVDSWRWQSLNPAGYPDAR